MTEYQRVTWTAFSILAIFIVSNLTSLYLTRSHLDSSDVCIAGEEASGSCEGCLDIYYLGQVIKRTQKLKKRNVKKMLLATGSPEAVDHSCNFFFHSVEGFLPKPPLCKIWCWNWQKMLRDLLWSSCFKSYASTIGWLRISLWGRNGYWPLKMINET